MGFHLKIPLYQRFHTFFGRFHTFTSNIKIINLANKFAQFGANKIYKVCVGSYGSFPISMISHLFMRFHTFISNIKIFNLDHKNRLNKCQ